MSNPDQGGRRKASWAAASIGLLAFGATATVALFKSRALPAGGTLANAKGDTTALAGRGERREEPSAASLSAGYELHDTRVRVLAIVMVVSVATIVVSTAAALFLYTRFDRYFAGASDGLTREQRATIMPPLPHLQADPYRDINAVLMEQQQALTTYGHATQSPDSAHIPIERAMQQVVGKPLDAAAQADAAGAPGTTQPLPQMPAFPAAQSHAKPANAVQGEGRPGAVAPDQAPSSLPEKREPSKDKQ